ncbi:hypothetical protein HMPREF9069_00024 [Atopobium sp. oral taxon 810 str. F0209]|nr:hypothetical protein HMPREF9069_00024 [Atopobium sp. oral taxon 810 str. F0209]
MKKEPFFGWDVDGESLAVIRAATLAVTFSVTFTISVSVSQ